MSTWWHRYPHRAPWTYRHDQTYPWLDSDPVLVYCVNGAYRVAVYRVDDDDPGRARWLVQGPDSYDITDSVTHWRELPAAPRETRED